MLQTTTRLSPEGHWLRGEAHAFLVLSFSAIGAETEVLKHRAQALQLYEDILGEQSVRYVKMAGFLSDI